jgi:hypothetical protein
VFHKKVDILGQPPVGKVRAAQCRAAEEGRRRHKLREMNEHMREEMIALDLTLGRPEVVYPASKLIAAEHG